MNYSDIESAGFRSWPALEETKENGIVLRYSNGYTKRANSANVLEEQEGELSGLVSDYEAFFASKGLPCIFRIPSFSNNQKLDLHLELGGYKSIDQTLVLHKALAEAYAKQSNLVEKCSEDWILSYCQIRGLDIADHLTHLEMLQRIKDKPLMAVLVEDKVEVACGLGVISNGYFGLFDIATKPSALRKGYATKLIKGMLNWAIENGASNAYLQVVAENQAAVTLYQKLGYEPCYEYWYRISEKS